MSDKMSNFSTNQRRALAALLAEKNIRAAARSSRLAEKTLYRYLADPKFRQELLQAQTALYANATQRLAAGISAALDELEKLMIGATSEAVKRQAVNDWLTFALKLREQNELEARISVLEASLK